MKTKVENPFIYFQGDQQMVFVYEIQTMEDVAMEDLVDGSKLTAYEMKEGESFEDFTQDGKSAPEGTSFFMSEKQIEEMVEEINRVLQGMRDSK